MCVFVFGALRSNAPLTCNKKMGIENKADMTRRRGSADNAADVTAYCVCSQASIGVKIVCRRRKPMP